VASPYKEKPLWLRPFAALRCALAGLRTTTRHEVAFQMELVAVAILAPLAFYVSDGAVERALLVGSLLLVLIVEVVNSAIEATLDRISLETDPLIGGAKDVASAAVLLSLVNAAMVWGLVLLSG
jgi:diacylglycerol kinase (ATP)